MSGIEDEVQNWIATDDVQNMDTENPISYLEETYTGFRRDRFNIGKGVIGDAVVTQPIVTGHEGSGTVLKVGSAVRDLSPGDRVGLEPNVVCMKCDWCKEGRGQLCPDQRMKSTPPDHQGMMEKYHLHHYAYCHKLPNLVSHEEGALLEPLACAVHACHRAELKTDHRVLILGAGPVGLLVMLVAKAMGISEVGICDINAKRIEFAKTIGAKYGILLDGSEVKSNTAKITQVLHPNAVMECTGVQSCIQLGLRAVTKGGLVALVGLGSPDAILPVHEMLRKEIDLRGVIRSGPQCYQEALSLVASGQVDVKPLISHRFNLETVMDAFSAAINSTTTGAVKVLVNCD